jgi:hypothetical protein
MLQAEGEINHAICLEIQLSVRRCLHFWGIERISDIIPKIFVEKIAPLETKSSVKIISKHSSARSLTDYLYATDSFSTQIDQLLSHRFTSASASMSSET